MPAPLIGISTHPSTSPQRAVLDTLLANIIEGVERAGGLPVLIPADLSDASLRGIFERCDGILLSGGDDLDPQRYGRLGLPAVSPEDARRDQIELSLARWSLMQDKPIFGICRGMQTMNVALGGTLYVDTSEHPDVQRHAYYPNLPFDLRAHPVQIEEDSTLARILNRPTLMVNSLHHQACRDVAASLHVIARAPDGLVEAIESAQHPFALGVQWHPEALLEAPEMLAIFEGFISASAAG